MASSTIELWCKYQNQRFFVATVDKKTLSDLSASCSRQMAQYTNPLEVTLLEEMQPQAAQVVCNWINTVAEEGIQPLDVLFIVEVPTLYKMVQIHKACRVMQLKAEERGNAVRDEILKFMSSTKDITLEDFKLVVDGLSFDAGLVNRMKQEVAQRDLVARITIGSLGDIVAYCGQVGLSDEMKRIYAERKAKLLEREDGQHILNSAQKWREREARENRKAVEGGED